MAYSLENTTDLTALGNAIRAKTGSAATMTVAEMATAVNGISAGVNISNSYLEVKTSQQEIDNITYNVYEYIYHGFTDTNPPPRLDGIVAKLNQETTMIKINLADTTITTLEYGLLDQHNLENNIDNRYWKFESLILPNTLTAIKKYSCRKLFTGSITNQILTIPSNVSSIGERAFLSNTALNGVVLPANSSSLTIGTYAFYQCGALTSITFPSNIYKIEDSCFRDCVALTTVRFLGTPNSIHKNAFLNDAALTDIYVPWSEGQIANAPWGATNATIHYDTVN